MKAALLFPLLLRRQQRKTPGNVERIISEKTAMFNSKFFTVMIVLTFLVLGGAVALQVLEMNEYNLFETLQERYFPSK
jgi:hypothetical protein